MLRKLDAAFVTKAIYGLVNVMVVLLVMEDHPPTAIEGAVTLFGATLAIALVEGYAELVGETIAHRRALSWHEIRHIGTVVAPVLAAAQIPVIILLLSAVNIYSVETAISVDQLVVFTLLAGYGIRAILFQHKAPLRRLLSAVILVVLTLLILGLKVTFH